MPFSALWAGTKRHEIRVDDRGFEVGDLLRLREWVPQPASTHPVTPYDGYTGREELRPIRYITRGGQFGLPVDLVVMSLGDGPHDRSDCPCDHDPEEDGVCGGCNCADVP